MKNLITGKHQWAALNQLEDSSSPLAPQNDILADFFVPPTVLVSEWVGQVKDASAHYINHQVAKRKLLEWQSGYGVVSFGTKDLDWVINYIENPKEHHARGMALERLEKSAGSSQRGKPVETG